MNDTWETFAHSIAIIATNLKAPCQASLRATEAGHSTWLEMGCRKSGRLW